MARCGGRQWLVWAGSPVLVAGLVLVPVSSAAAATPPSITVTPSTNLADLQLVTIAGKNFTANAIIATLECAATATTESGCDLGTLIEINDTATGTVSLSRYVRRIITPSTGKLDCASKLGACAMVAANISNTTEHAGALLDFNPKIPPATPKVQATPSFGLADHQSVIVAGSGMIPNGSAELAQCQAGAPPSFSTCDSSTVRSVPVGANGHFSATWIVHRILNLSSGGPVPNTFDCASKPGACILSAGNISGVPAPATDYLSFNPAIPPVAQRLKITPTTGLVDHQLVQLEGSGYTPGDQVVVIQCQKGATSAQGCDYGTITYTTAGFLGHFHITYVLHRVIQIGTSPFDCASKPGACVVAAANEQRTSEAASQPLSFNPSMPPVTANITVTPHTGLFDNELVGVAGKGFTPFSVITVSECSANALTETPTFAYCSVSTQATASRTGAISGSLFVHRVISTQDGLLGCASKPGACVVIAQRSNGVGAPTTSDFASAPLAFR